MRMVHVELEELIAHLREDTPNNRQEANAEYRIESRVSDDLILDTDQHIEESEFDLLYDLKDNETIIRDLVINLGWSYQLRK